MPDEETLSLGALMRHPLVTSPRNASPYVERRDLVLRENLPRDGKRHVLPAHDRREGPCLRDGTPKFGDA